MDDQANQIKQFWAEQAEAFKESPLATAPDTYYRELEIKSILSYLPTARAGRVLDVGCGNGYSSFIFAHERPQLEFIGLDYSAEMIRYAREALGRKAGLSPRLTFTEGNVLTLSRDPSLTSPFDYIISERCVINLLNWEEQKQALLEMKSLLKPTGRIILCENTQEGLARLNGLRQALGLPPITVRWHNYYLPEEKLRPFMAQEFVREEEKNIGSLYYIVSRVVYAKLCALEGKEPAYLHPINKIASQLPYLGDYSPNFIFVLRNKP